MPSPQVNRKRKLPTSFLESQTLSLVSDFPTTKEEDSYSSRRIVNTNVVSESTKAIFLDRFSKEVVQPFRPSPSKGVGGLFVMMENGTLTRQPQCTRKEKSDDSEDNIWRERLVMGTNQCLRNLENDIKNQPGPPQASLMVLARDIYPPTMLAHAPVMAKRLGIPVLLLPGKASNEIGQAVGVKKTSILLFLSSKANDQGNSKINSFVDFVISDMIPKEEQS